MLVSQREIKITAGPVTMSATLNDTATAAMIWDALPIEASANTWGDEIYFGIPVAAGEELGQEVVELGDLGYWPPGSAFCMFFGPTPMSRGDEIRPASPVTVLGPCRAWMMPVEPNGNDWHRFRRNLPWGSGGHAVSRHSKASRYQEWSGC